MRALQPTCILQIVAFLPMRSCPYALCFLDFSVEYHPPHLQCLYPKPLPCPGVTATAHVCHLVAQPDFVLTTLPAFQCFKCLCMNEGRSGNPPDSDVFFLAVDGSNLNVSPSFSLTSYIQQQASIETWTGRIARRLWGHSWTMRTHTR